MKKNITPKMHTLICGLAVACFSIDSIIHFTVGEGFTAVNLLTTLCAVLWWVVFVGRLHKARNSEVK